MWRFWISSRIKTCRQEQLRKKKKKQQNLSRISIDCADTVLFVLFRFVFFEASVVLLQNTALAWEISPKDHTAFYWQPSFPMFCFVHVGGRLQNGQVLSELDAGAKTCEQRCGFPLMAMCPFMVLYSQDNNSAHPTYLMVLVCSTSLPCSMLQFQVSFWPCLLNKKKRFPACRERRCWHRAIHQQLPGRAMRTQFRAFLHPEGSFRLFRLGSSLTQPLSQGLNIHSVG